MAEEAQPPSRPSSTPSWVMLGFILGVLFVWALPRRAPAPPPAGKPATPAPPPAKQERPRLTTIEEVFSEWGQYAVWDHDATEVALWNTTTRSFSDCYEVLRVGDRYYFRSIPELTRPELTHGVPNDPACPLEFTETVEQREQWLNERIEAGGVLTPPPPVVPSQPPAEVPTP